MTKPSRGYIAWLAWGGDSGKAWANKIVFLDNLSKSKLKNPLQSIPTEKRIRSILRNHIVSLNRNQLKRIEAIYIVGSTAKKDDKPTSDIDIAVIMTPPKRGTLRSVEFTERFHNKYQSDLHKPKYENRILDFQFFWTTDHEWQSYSKIRLKNPRTRRNRRDVAISKWDHPMREGSEVQTVMFSRKHFDGNTARAWLRKHDFKAPKMDKTINYLRYRQQEPETFHSKEIPYNHVQ